jgi:hypothetical protein
MVTVQPTWRELLNDPEKLEERIQSVVTWAKNRIEHCRGLEAKFGARGVSIEASTERRALQAVLAGLAGEWEATEIEP